MESVDRSRTREALVGFADEQGNVVPASYYGMRADFPLELHVTLTFEEHDGKTKMTLRHAGFPDGENSDLAEIGWNESFDKLAESLRYFMME